MLTRVTFVSNVIKAGLGVMALTGIVAGSVIAHGGNFVCDWVKNPTCGFVSGVRGIVIPASTTSTATGGNVKVSNGAKYNTILLNSPYNATASARGLRTGTGAVYGVLLDIIKNGLGVSMDCVIAKSGNTGTSGLLIFNNKSATGSYFTTISSSGAMIGSTDVFKCGTLTAPDANFRASLTALTMDSDVGH